MMRRSQAQVTRGTWTGPRHRGLSLAVAVLLLLLVALVAEAAAPFTVLRVQVVDDTGTRRTAAVLPATSEERFEVRFQHSYNDFTIREFFARAPGTEGGVIAVEQYVDGDGAGIAGVPGETEFVSAGPGWSRLAGLHRPLDGPLRMRIGMVADHRLVHRCRNVTLTAIADPAALAEIGWDRAGPTEYVRARLALQRAEDIGATCAPPDAADHAARATPTNQEIRP